MGSLAGPLLIAAVLGLIPARIAAAKGRSFRRWWFYGWMLFIVALPHAMLLRPRRGVPDVIDVVPVDVGPAMTACPSCGKEVRADTPACPYCRAAVAV